MNKGLFWGLVVLGVAGYYYWSNSGEPDLEYREVYSRPNHTNHYYFDQGVMREISDNSIAADSDVQGVLQEIGLPNLREGGVEIFGSGYDKQVSEHSVVWNGYQGGRLIAYTEECGTANCISKLTLVPSTRDRMKFNADQSSSSIFVAAESYGENWPFTVDYGVIRCQRGALYFSTPDDGRFPLNGLARSSAGGTKDLHDIWKDHPSPYTQKYPIGDLINQGLEVCD